jgi:hypothetical protein
VRQVAHLTHYTPQQTPAQDVLAILTHKDTQMTARIHFTWPDGTEDSIVLSGSVDEIREQAQAEVARREATNPWSEILAE